MEKINLTCFVFSWSAHPHLCFSSALLHSFLHISEKKDKTHKCFLGTVLSNSYLSFSSSRLTALTAQHSLTGLKRQMHGQSQITTFWVKDLDVMREIWDAWQMFSYQKLSHDLPLKAILSKLMLFIVGWENIISNMDGFG